MKFLVAADNEDAPCASAFLMLDLNREHFEEMKRRLQVFEERADPLAGAFLYTSCPELMGFVWDEEFVETLLFQSPWIKSWGFTGEGLFTPNHHYLYYITNFKISQ